MTRLTRGKDQHEVLRSKDYVTRNDLGLQLWGEMGVNDSAAGLRGSGHHGDSLDTTERSARIGGVVKSGKRPAP